MVLFPARFQTEERIIYESKRACNDQGKENRNRERRGMMRMYPDIKV